MRKKRQNIPLAVQNMQGAAGLRMQEWFKRIALGLAIVVGVVALYFCLLPALAQGGTAWMYFDNSLSQYESVKCIVNGSEVAMERLTEGDARMPADAANVSTEYVYVTATPIEVGATVQFIGTDSGTVYDTTVNYRPKAASREWGYDYQNFQWTSGELTFDGERDCYYAPPKLLQYTYSAVAQLVDIRNNNTMGESTLQHLIWAHGDRNAEGKSAKPEASDAFIEPNTAWNRTFANAAFEMNGEFNPVESVNTLAEHSQSNNGNTYEGSVVLNGDGDNGLSNVEPNGGKVYHATADFYDFFSDWEIAGKQLSQHTLSYSYEDAHMKRFKLHDWIEGSVGESATEEEIETEITVDGVTYSARKHWYFSNLTDSSWTVGDTVTSKTVGGFTMEYANRTNPMWLMPAADVNHTGTGGSLHVYEMTSPGDADYDMCHVYVPVTDYCTSGGQYLVRMYFAHHANNKDGSAITPTLLYEVVNADGSIAEQDTIATGSFAKDLTKWDELQGSFTAPALTEGQTLRLCIETNYIRYFIDDFTLYEKVSKWEWTFPTDTSVATTTSGDYSITSVGDWNMIRLTSVETATYIEKNTTTHTEDGTGSLHFLRQNNAEHHLYLPAEGILQDGMTYTFSMWLYGNNNPEYKPNLKVEYINSSGELDASKTVSVQSFVVGTAKTWTECKESFTYTAIEGYTPRICIEVNNKNIYLDDITITKSVPATVYDTADNPPPTIILENAVTVLEQKIQVQKVDAKDKNGTQYYVDTNQNIVEADFTGTKYAVQVNEFSDKDAYTLEGTVTSAVGGTLRVLIRYDANKNTRIAAEEQDLGTYMIKAGEPTEIAVRNFQHLPGHKSATIVLQMEDGSPFIYDLDFFKEYFTLDANGSFSEGTDRISYSYQGMLWNQAISDYYSDLNAQRAVKWSNTDSDTTNNIIPLYFASNSWLTGNGRYNFIDNYDIATNFTQADVTGGVKFITMNADPDLARGTYLFPFSRQYYKDLFGFNQDASNPFVTVDIMNTPLGQSNSRAVTGLVDLVPVTQEDGTVANELQLANTGVESPYFNEDFINGNNSLNAKLGNFYNDVKFDFVFNEDTGYYEYDSTRAKYATRVTQATDENNQSYYYMDYYNYDEIVYQNMDVAGVKKADSSMYDENGSSQTIYQFFPFNSPKTNNKFATENLMFSMNLDIPFTIQTKKEDRGESMFKFSGDDDVWVYVDGELALDIGGTHTAVGGLVDLKNGYAVTGSSYLDKTGAVVTTSNDKKYSAGTFVKGTDEGVTDVEKAAFALIASARILNAEGSELVEVGVDPSQSGSIPLQSFELNGSENVYAYFFDDVYIAADSTVAPTYSYVIDKEAGTIEVTFTNLRKNNNETDEEEYKLEDANGNFVTGGTVKFALSVFSIDGEESTADESNVDLAKHTLSVYYMERGLNSTNFKMEFNFVQPTTREVSKEWADGLAEHAGAAEQVQVELYRTEPTQITTEVAETGWVDETEAFELDDGIMFVKVQANRGGTSKQDNFRFYAKEEKIIVYYEKNSADRNVYLTINGIPVDKEMYDRYRDEDNPEQSLFYIYLDGEDSSVIEPLTDDNASTYTGSDNKGAYIYVPASYTLRVQINDEYLDRWKTTAVPATEDLSKYGKKSGGDLESENLNQWVWGDVQGFLVEGSFHTRNTDGSSADLLTNSKAGINEEVGARDTYNDTSSGMTYGKENTPLHFVILKNKEFTKATGNNPSYYTYNMDVKLVPDGSSLTLESNIKSNGLAAVSQRVTNWYGVETAFSSRECPGAYGIVGGTMKFFDISYYDSKNNAPAKPSEITGNETYLANLKESDPWSLTVTPTVNTLVEYSAHDRFTRALDNDSTKGQQGNGMDYVSKTMTRSTGNQILAETGVKTEQLIDTYTDAILIDTVTLNNENNWKHVFDTIVEGETVGGVMKDYRYFIREVTVQSNYGSIDDYKQTYYDASGNVLEPYPINYTDPDTGVTETLTLYPNASSVRVANIPLTDLNLAKDWGDSVQDDDKTSQVVMRIYSSMDGVNGKLVKKQAISSASEWKAMLEDLPLYEATVTLDGNGSPVYTWNRIMYYAAEDPVYYWRDDGEGTLTQVQFIATYAPSEKTSLTVDSGSVTVYKFNEANRRSLAISVENSLNNPGEFNLQLVKISDDGTEYLNGAEFELYQLVNGAYVLKDTYTTNENGVINFGSIDVSATETVGDSVTFKLIETKAPIGFALPADGNQIEFTVTQGQEKALTLTSKSYGTLVTHEATDDMTALKFTVKNKVKPIIIPNTGGTGVSPVYTGGAIFIFTALAGVLLLRKRSERPEK